jgi:hypothetical protein
VFFEVLTLLRTRKDKLQLATINRTNNKFIYNQQKVLAPTSRSGEPYASSSQRSNRAATSFTVSWTLAHVASSVFMTGPCATGSKESWGVPALEACQHMLHTASAKARPSTSN